MGIVFFEIKKSESSNFRALECLIPNQTSKDLRGYFGAIILQAESKDRALTGRVTFIQFDEPSPEFGDLSVAALGGNIKTPTGKYYSALILWPDYYFAIFAFDLIAMMSGTYQNGIVPSFHGLPFPHKKISEQK